MEQPSYFDRFFMVFLVTLGGYTLLRSVGKFYFVVADRIGRSVRIALNEPTEENLIEEVKDGTS